MKHFTRFLFPVAVLAVAASSDAAAFASRPDRTFVTNGPVYAVVRSGDTIFIGGRFNQVGPRTGFGVEISTDGTLAIEQPEVSGGEGLVQAVAPDGSGGWYIGSLFTHVGGVGRNNIAHISADKSVDPSFDPDASGGIHALAVSGSTIYAGGFFSSIGGQPRNRIAALNTDGTVTSFDPNADIGVFALVVAPNGTLHAGGPFRGFDLAAQQGFASFSAPP